MSWRTASPPGYDLRSFRAPTPPAEHLLVESGREKNDDHKHADWMFRGCLHSHDSVIVLDSVKLRGDVHDGPVGSTLKYVC